MFTKIKKLYNLQKLYSLIRKGYENKKLLESSKYWTELFTLAWKIKEIREMLAGYKTYIIAILSGALTVMKALGYIDETLYNTLMALLASGGIASVAAKINRIEKNRF